MLPEPPDWLILQPMGGGKKGWGLQREKMAQRSWSRGAEAVEAQRETGLGSGGIWRDEAVGLSCGGTWRNLAVGLGCGSGARRALAWLPGCTVSLFIPAMEAVPACTWVPPVLHSCPWGWSCACTQAHPGPHAWPLGCAVPAAMLSHPKGLGQVNPRHRLCFRGPRAEGAGRDQSLTQHLHTKVAGKAALFSGSPDNGPKTLQL